MPVNKAEDSVGGGTEHGPVARPRDIAPTMGAVTPGCRNTHANAICALFAPRFFASEWLLTEKHFRKVIGHRDFWTLAVALGREEICCISEKVA